MASACPRCGIELIKEFEAFRGSAYPDPKAGWKIPTVGYGTTRYPDGSPVRKGDVITRERAEEYLAYHLDRICTPALEKIPSWPGMNEHRRGALYSFAYNLGAHFYGARNFTSITLVCDSPEKWADATWIEKQFLKYRNPGTSAEAGLRRRRKAEAELFCKPLTERNS